MNEAKLKKWIRSRWSDWLESYEPRRGGGTGIADLQIIVDERLVPMELKVGVIKKETLFTKEVRGAQTEWHRRLNAAGVRSVFLIGARSDENGSLRIFVVNGRFCRKLTNPVATCRVIELSAGLSFSEELREYIRGLFRQENADE